MKRTNVSRDDDCTHYPGGLRWAPLSKGTGGATGSEGGLMWPPISGGATAGSEGGLAFKGTCPRLSIISLAFSGWYSCMCSENLEGENKASVPSQTRSLG